MRRAGDDHYFDPWRGGASGLVYLGMAPKLGADAARELEHRYRCRQNRGCAGLRVGTNLQRNAEPRGRENRMAVRRVNQIVEQLRQHALAHDGADLTDAQLLECFIGAREERAFEAIVRRHGSMVWSVCRRVLRNTHDAEDAFQAAFLVLACKAATIRSRELVAHWLYGVAYQTALKARARAAKRLARERPMNNMPEPVAAPQESLQDWRPLLDQELSALPEKYRIPIVLCDLNGKTRKTAAEQLGLPEGTLHSRLARARMLLGRRLARRGVAFSGGAIAVLLAQDAVSASVSAPLIGSTVKAAISIAAGNAVTAAATSAEVAALAEGVLKAMLMSKVKTAVAALLALVLAFLMTGTTVIARRTAAEQSAPPPAPIAAAQDTKSIIEGSRAGDRKELVPGIAFRWCPAGKFKMGEGDDAVAVEFSKGFWLGETEITQGQWQKLMGTRPWTRGRLKGFDGLELDIKEGPDYAASYISYDDALSFCEKLTTQHQDAGRLPIAWKYALPTEAQWEYACRAGTKTRYSFGDDESQLSEYAWFRANPNDVSVVCAHKVGLKKPNAWGLRDMHGNVWEWCRDLYGDRLTGGKDPVGPSSGKNRVVRGGGWNDPAASCTAANRFYYNPRLGKGLDGFRIAVVPCRNEKPAGGGAAGQTRQAPAEEKGKDKEVITAWGKEVGGVQAGLGYLPGQQRAYHTGETVRLVVRVRNVGNKEVQFVYAWESFYAQPPVVTDAAGNPVSFTGVIFTGWLQFKEVHLAPGKEVDLCELNVALCPASAKGKDRPCSLYDTGTFHLQFQRLGGNIGTGEIKYDPVLSKLVTGKLDLQVVSVPPPP